MAASNIPVDPHAPAWQWDVFCRVIDNWGDAGVCLRLCRQLVAHGHRVRLWVDDPTPLGFMQGSAAGPAGLQVRHWLPTLPAAQLQQVFADAPPQVWVEAFGCEIATEFVASYAHLLGGSGQLDLKHWPTWINLEYLSAEAVVLRLHGLPSPISSGPAAGVHKRFFYPGFVAGTGGLLREADLADRQARFDPTAWRRAHGLPEASAGSGGGHAFVASLFCYEPAVLPNWLQALQLAPQASRLCVTAGRSHQAVRAALALAPNALLPARVGHLQIKALPLLSQADYDHLLWACDLNLVRGEDSLVRALWAGQPFIWQIYPQHDKAHHAKLAAFLDWLEAPPGLRQAHGVWNGLQHGPMPHLTGPTGKALLAQWRDCAQQARARLLAQPDLMSQLCMVIKRWRMDAGIAP